MRLPNNIVLHQEGAALTSKDLKKFVDENNPRLDIEKAKVKDGNFILEYRSSESEDRLGTFKIRQSKIASVLYMLHAELQFKNHLKKYKNDW
jgi:hypothetical protein